MKRSHLMKNTYPLAVIFSFCWLFSPVNHQALADNTNERKVVVEQTKNEPIWKKKWDSVRKLVRDQEFKQAAKGYGELLNMKSNIEEARWEYLQVLTRLEEWDTASALVDSLIEQNPLSIEYRLKAGEIALERKEFERAAKYFSWILSKSPNSPDGLTALEGVVDALQGLGRHEVLLPLMEQLYIRKPNNPDLLKQLASTAMAQGKMGKAADYFSILIDHFPVADRIIFQAANIYGQMKNKAKAAQYWEMYLEKHPEYIPFQKNLSDYYLSLNDRAKALPHLLFLLENDKRSEQLLLKIGRIYLHDLKRPDKALVFLQEYGGKNPENKAVQDEIAEIQTVLANDLISIVENDGAWMLWKDLAQLTPNRTAIYLSMVDLLDSLGKEKEMYEVLNIIHKHDPKNREALLSLAEVELRRNRIAESIHYFDRVTGNVGIEKKYYLVKGHIQEKLGNELSALKSYEQYLYFERENTDVLLRCFKLSCNLGLVDNFKNYYSSLKKIIHDDKALLDIQKQYLDYLRKNHQFKDSEVVYSELISEIGGDPVATTEFLFSRADYLYDQGLAFEAEQLLRRVLISNVNTREALIKLVQLAIDEGEVARGLAWFSLLRCQPFNPSDVDVTISNQDLEVTLLQLELFSQQGRIDDVISYLNKVVFEQKEEGKQAGKLRRKLALHLIQMYMKKGLNQEGLTLAEKLASQYPTELRAQVLVRILRSSLFGKQVLSTNDDLSFSKLVMSAQYELQYGGIQNGLHLIEEALRRVQSSVEARVVKAKLLLANDQTEKALQIFQSLLSDFPENQYFEKQVLEATFLLGNNAQIVEEHYTKTIKAGQEAFKKRGFNAWRTIMLARSLAKIDRFDEAKDLYNMMIPIPIEEMLVRKIKKGDVEEDLLKTTKSIWDIITFSKPQKKDLVETVMAPYFVGKHLGKRIDILSTELYAEYRWQKQILAEKSTLLSRLSHGNK